MAGRVKGSKNKVTLNKTYYLQQCFTEEDISSWAEGFKTRMRSAETSNTEYVQLFNAISKFLILTKKEVVDYEMIAKVITETVSSKDEAEAIRQKIATLMGKN